MPPIRLAHRRGSASRCPVAGLGRTRRFQIAILTAQKNHWQPVPASDCPRVFRAPYILARACACQAESRGLALRNWERVPALDVDDFAGTPTGLPRSRRFRMAAWEIAVSRLRLVAGQRANFPARGYGLGWRPYPSKTQARPDSQGMACAPVSAGHCLFIAGFRARLGRRLPADCLLSPRFRIAGFSDAETRSSAGKDRFSSENRPPTQHLSFLAYLYRFPPVGLSPIT